MAQTNTNIFNPGSTNDSSHDNSEFDYTKAGIEIIQDDDARNKVRANIYKALTNSDNGDDLSLANAAYPPNVLAMKIEEELINEFKKSDSTTYKSSSSSAIKRLTGPRFAEARKLLSEGEFPLNEFIKGKTPKPQKKSAATNESENQQRSDDFGQANPVNRSRGVRPPMANIRGARGGPPRGVTRGGRGGRGAPMRGGISQTAEPIMRPQMSDSHVEIKETVSDEDDHQESNEETKQQPAIQIPKENTKEAENYKEEPQSKRNEPESEIIEPKEKAVIPSIRQVEKVPANPQVVQPIPSPSTTVDVQNHLDGPPKMPKTNTRRAQPTLGPQNAQPPTMNRGRGYKESLVVANVEEKPQIFIQQPVPQEEPIERIEIFEEEIVHEGEKTVENIEEEKIVRQSPVPVIPNQQIVSKKDDLSKESDDVINFDKTETKNFEESEVKKMEAKAMFGKMFDLDSSEKAIKTRGHSPNFSDFRYKEQKDDHSEDRLDDLMNFEVNKRAKNQRK